jgi:signal transduction histidine kinase
LQMLLQSSQLMSEVTKLIGSIMGKQTAAIGAVELRKLLNSMIAMVRPLIKENAELLYDPSSEPVFVTGSETFIKQIMINLILNARDAVEEKKLEGRKGLITLRLMETSDQKIKLAVTDNGIGLAAKETRREFQAFASTKQLRGGTGLGLWLSSHLAQKMRATLALSSEGPGLGATAEVIFQKV